jgi:hypothetical protein
MPVGMHRYPPGYEPDFWDPIAPSPTHRFALGRAGSSPLVTVGMNPSHASDLVSDATINRVIDASVELGHSGWVMLNLYPQRASSPSALGTFDAALSAANCRAITAILHRFGVREVGAAWGGYRHPTIVAAQADVTATLTASGVALYAFGTLTRTGQPRHPKPRGGRLDVSRGRFLL